MYNFENIKKCCFSGYRPEKFPFELNQRNIDFCLLKSRILKTLTALIEDECGVFYCGMARGFDILCGECVLALKREFSNIKLVCAVPYENQETNFSPSWKAKYYTLLQNADEVYYISKKYSSFCFQQRNMFMVDNSDYVMTWYDGKRGGTRNTLKYAAKKGRYIINLNTNYIDEFNNKQLGMGF